ncbi:MAG: hypothetical protein V8Q77_06510 [Bacilli bacterium]
MPLIGFAPDCDFRLVYGKGRMSFDLSTNYHEADVVEYIRGSGYNVIRSSCCKT